MLFTPFPKLNTSRLHLRRIKPEDADIILFLRSDPRVGKYIHRDPKEATKNNADALLFIEKLDGWIENNESIAWGITFKDNHTIIGTICLWNFSEDKTVAEVGYDLLPKLQGKGIMSEALIKIVDYGFNEIKVDKIEAFTHRDNESSKRLLEKNGFTLVPDRKDNGNSYNLVFEIIKK